MIFYESGTCYCHRLSHKQGAAKFQELFEDHFL